MIAIFSTSILAILAMNSLRISLNLPESGAAALKPVRWHYALIAEQVDSSFWQEVHRGARAAAAKVDAVIDLVGPEKFSADRSTELVRIATAARLDGIATCVTDTQLTRSAINEAVAAGIHVVTLENDAADSDQQCFVGVNGYDLGQSFGQLVASRETNGRVVILVSADPESDSLAEGQIFAGLRDYLAPDQRVGLERLEINRSSVFSVESAVRNMLVENQSPVSTIISLNTEDTLRVVETVAEYGRTNDVSILCYQENNDVLEHVQGGLVEAILASDPYQIGYDSIMALAELQRDSRTNEYIPSRLVAIDSTNVGAYMEAKSGHDPAKAEPAAAAVRP